VDRGHVFEQTYLIASSSLSSARDISFDLIDRHYRGVRVGATNVKTLDFDEEGLAKALIDLGTNADDVLKVFERPDKHYNSDADDVAELYVNEVPPASRCSGKRSLLEPDPGQQAHQGHG
jgi:hypothetical protein